MYSSCRAALFSDHRTQKIMQKIDSMRTESGNRRSTFASLYSMATCPLTCFILSRASADHHGGAALPPPFSTSGREVCSRPPERRRLRFARSESPTHLVTTVQPDAALGAFRYIV